VLDVFGKVFLSVSDHFLGPYDILIGMSQVIGSLNGRPYWPEAPSAVSTAPLLSAGSDSGFEVGDAIPIPHLFVDGQELIVKGKALCIGGEVVFSPFDLTLSESCILAAPMVGVRCTNVFLSVTLEFEISRVIEIFGDFHFDVVVPVW